MTNGTSPRHGRSAGSAAAGPSPVRSTQEPGIASEEGAPIRSWVGTSPERVEDAALLRGKAKFADDVSLPVGAGVAAFVRSPYPHARIARIDTAEAKAIDGVYAIVTGADVRELTRPFIVGVKQPMSHWCLAVDTARYVGEPVAIVIARDRYVAEDAAERVDVEYEPLIAVVDPLAASRDDAPVLHGEVGSNVVHERRFAFGDPDGEFSRAARTLRVETVYPRNSCTPIEGFVVTAEYLDSEDIFEVTSNFQGPFTLQPVMARALGVPGPRLRLRAPRDSGGSFGIKQGVFPYIVALAVAAKKVGRPVRWVEDRLEHLLGAGSATNRVTALEVAFEEDGRIVALDYDQLDDCGAYLRAPEPATLYRMHGNMTGAYDIQHVRIRNRVVLTNKTPSGLNRGFGGPQVYFPLETAVRRIAETLGLSPLDVIRRNLVPKEAMPYQGATGARLDSGDYAALVARGVEAADLNALLAEQAAARAEGRLVGIGFAAVVEPSISNMGYITALLTPEERERAGPKNGGISVATVNIDPSGGISVTAASTPQGQGHRTVLAQVVADALGVSLDDVVVNLELDTQKDAWSIASGNYSSRFSGAVAGAAHLAATRLREKLALAAAPVLNTRAEQLTFENGRIAEATNPDNSLSLGRVAGLMHWSPGSLPEGMSPGARETEIWTMPQLEAPDPSDRVNSSGAYGFVFDVCAVEVDRVTGQVAILRYVTAHDAGRRLNPAMVDGQIRGGFAQALGAALLEELRYDDDGNFLSGTFADYLVPTAMEVPDPTIVHIDSPSPVTPLGAKGVGEGNSMSTPVCIANAVANALGVPAVSLPLTPANVCTYLDREGDS